MKTVVILFAGFYEPEALKRMHLWANAIPNHIKTVVFCDEENTLNIKNVCSISTEKTVIVSEKNWTISLLLAKMSTYAQEYNADTIVYSWADCPFIDIDLSKTLYARHKKYTAEYSFTDGYPYGLSPEIIDSGACSILSKLALQKEEFKNQTVLRNSIFNLLKTDINSYEVETLLSPEDFRMYRLELASGTKRGLILCNRLFSLLKQSGRTEYTTLELSKLAVTSAEILQTVPSFYSIQITTGCHGKCLYCPYPSEYKKKYNESVENSQINMDFSCFQKIIKQASDLSGEAVISLSLWGEPIRHPELIKFIQEVLKYSGLSVLIETSGESISTEVIEKIANIAQPEQIRQNGKPPVLWIVGIDAFDSSMYKTMHPDTQLSFDEVLNTYKTLESFFPHAVYPQFIRTIKNESQLESFYRNWPNRIIQKYDFFSGKLPQYKTADLSPVKRNPCWHLRNDISILYDGSVPLCRDCIFNNILGNINNEPMESVWIKSVSYLQEQINGTYSEICEKCDEYYTFNF